MRFLNESGLFTFWNSIKDKFVNKESGKGLSTNDYTTDEKTKLSGIENNANNYTHPTTSGYKHIPDGGSSGNILVWSQNGTAAWGSPAESEIPVATTEASGLMSSNDKAKLDGIDLTKYVETTDMEALTSTEINTICV